MSRLAKLSLLLNLTFFCFFAWECFRLAGVPTSDASEYWFSGHQTYFLATGFLGIGAALNIPIHLNFLQSLVLGFIAVEIKLMDAFIHPSLLYIKFYEFLGLLNAGSNPQLAKITFLVLAIGCIVVSSITRRLYFPAIFAALLIFINLIAASLYHGLLPSGLLNDLISSRTQLLQKAIDHDESDLRSFCELNQITCLTIENDKIDMIADPSISKMQLSYLDNLLKQGVTSEKYSLIVDKNSNPSIYLSRKISSERRLVFYDVLYPKLQWDRVLGYFYKGCFYVSFGWFYFMYLLAIIHKDVRLNRLTKFSHIFKKTSRLIL